jgi:sugar lactone lactonase YvrE
LGDQLILGGLTADREDVYVSGNLTIDYNPKQIKTRDFREPHFFYLGVWENCLRFFTAEGELIPSPEELAAQERQWADQAEQQLAALKAKLKAQGIELED